MCEDDTVLEGKRKKFCFRPFIQIVNWLPLDVIVQLEHEKVQSTEKVALSSDSNSANLVTE